MVAPIVAAKAAKDVVDNKLAGKKDANKSGGTFFKVLLSILLIIIILLLLAIATFMFFGWSLPFSANTLPVFFDSYGSSPGKSTTSQYYYNYDYTDNPYFPGGMPGEGCYWAYICPGVPPENCDNCTEDYQSCVNNSQCCSNCCKYDDNGRFRCVPEEECNACEEYLGHCTNNSDCCSGCCRENGECGFEQECSQNSCVQENKTCTNNSDCCAGLLCKYGVCKQDCTEYAFQCESNSDCCSECCKTMGGAYKECRFAQECTSCVQERGTCANSSQCCTGLTCQNGICAQEQQCLALNETCLRDNNLCCSGCCDYILGGQGFQCLPEEQCNTFCGEYGYGCKMDSDCCANNCLDNSTCGCIQYGYSCPKTGSCCPGYECKNGMCSI